MQGLAAFEPAKKPKATWVEPVAEAEIAYSTVTESALLREAVFKGRAKIGITGARRADRASSEPAVNEIGAVESPLTQVIVGRHGIPDGTGGRPA